MEKIKLNLGCGNDYLGDFINVDSGNCRCDIKHDLSETPYPFEDNSVEYIRAIHVLEHLKKEKFVDICKELHRICLGGAIIQIVVPYALSDNFFTDPTHAMPFTLRTFDYFDRTKPLGENGKIYGWPDLFRVESGYLDCGENGPNVIFNLKVVK